MCPLAAWQCMEWPFGPEFAKPTFDFPLVFYLRSDHPRWFLDGCKQIQPATLQQGLVISGPHLFLLVCGGGCKYLYLHWLHFTVLEPAELFWFDLQLPNIAVFPSLSKNCDHHASNPRTLQFQWLKSSVDENWNSTAIANRLEHLSSRIISCGWV